MMLPSIVVVPMFENTPPPNPSALSVLPATFAKPLPLIELFPSISIGPPRIEAMPPPT
jgi:hypothetical protein